MITERNGIIVGIDSNHSWVYIEGEIYQALIKKNLLRQQQPVVGDCVTLEIANPQTRAGVISSFQPRKNFLPKPKVANIDQVLVITSLHEPDFNSYLLNKYLIFLNALKVEPVIVFTKSDLINPEQDHELLKKIDVYRALGYRTLTVSNKNKSAAEIKRLWQILTGKISAFVGQTGAGKSTTLNRFLSSDNYIKTRSISRALNRGRHTTTTTKLYPLGDFGFIADTPGFGNFDLKDWEIKELVEDLPLLKPYLGTCKYDNCTHVTEEDCSLRMHKKVPKVAQFIYDDYCQLINELKRQQGLTPWKKRK